MIYTRKGDKGSTYLLNKKISKNSKEIECLASLDELNSFIGLTASFSEKKTRKELNWLQEKIYVLMAEIAGYKKKITKEDVKKLEEKCDVLEKKIGKITNFIMPTGTKTAALLHVTRTITRKTEIKIVKLKLKNKNMLAFINRLSDLFYLMALNENKKAKTKLKKLKIK